MCVGRAIATPFPLHISKVMSQLFFRKWKIYRVYHLSPYSLRLAFHNEDVGCYDLTGFFKLRT
jgi:hypothetical protein